MDCSKKDCDVYDYCSKATKWDRTECEFFELLKTNEEPVAEVSCSDLATATTEHFKRMNKKLSAMSDEKAAVEGLVSQPIHYGKDYEMFCKFRRRVNQGGHPCVIGSDYVVMARTHYDEIIKAAQKGG